MAHQPGAGPRMRRYLPPGPASPIYDFEPRVDGQHTLTNQIHYLTRPTVEGIQSDRRVLCCVGMARKAIFDEMTTATRLHVADVVKSQADHQKAVLAFDRQCHYQPIYSITLGFNTYNYEEHIAVDPPLDLSHWRTIKSAKSRNVSLQHNDLVRIVCSLQKPDMAWDHYALVEQPWQGDFWSAPIVDHHYAAQQVSCDGKPHSAAYKAVWAAKSEIHERARNLTAKNAKEPGRWRRDEMDVKLQIEVLRPDAKLFAAYAPT